MTDMVPGMGIQEEVSMPDTPAWISNQAELAKTLPQSILETEMKSDFKKITDAQIIAIYKTNGIYNFDLLKRIFWKVTRNFNPMNNPSSNIKTIPIEVLNLIVWILSREKCNGCADSTATKSGGKVDYIIPNGTWKPLLARLKMSDTNFIKLSPEEKEFFRINTEAINKKEIVIVGQVRFSQIAVESQKKQEKEKERLEKQEKEKVEN